MPAHSKATIIGVGLIGGSIGLAMRERKLAERVVGVGRRQSSLDRALEHQVVDEATIDLATGVADADIVIVATPVDSVVDDVAKALAAAPASALVTDAGSTKAKICAEVGVNSQFIGSHPLAGDHRSGPEFARGDLFVDKVVVVTPTESTPAELTDRATKFWESLGATAIEMTPEKHDQALAATSHLPHLVASALAACTPEDCLPLAATGWADTTRVAAADPKLWTQIFSQNTPSVLAALDGLIEQLNTTRAHLLAEDCDQIETFLQQAKRTRDALGN